jgi:hypothetical protein
MPGAADDLALLFENMNDQRGVDVAAVDIEGPDRQLAAEQVLEILLDGVCGFLFGTIRRCNRACQDQARIEASRQVALEAVEPLTLTLAPVTHFLVLDRYPTIRGDTITDLNGGGFVAAVTAGSRVRFEILLDDLVQRLDVIFERWTSDFFWQAVANPRLQ